MKAVQRRSYFFIIILSYDGTFCFTQASKIYALEIIYVSVELIVSFSAIVEVLHFNLWKAQRKSFQFRKGGRIHSSDAGWYKCAIPPPPPPPPSLSPSLVRSYSHALFGTDSEQAYNYIPCGHVPRKSFRKQLVAEKIKEKYEMFRFCEVIVCIISYKASLL